MDYRGSYNNNSSNYGLSSTSGYGDKFNSSHNGGRGTVNKSSQNVCHYCGKVFNYLYDLNNHYVICPKRPGKYGAEQRGLTSSSTQIEDGATA